MYLLGTALSFFLLRLFDAKEVEVILSALPERQNSGQKKSQIRQVDLLLHRSITTSVTSLFTLAVWATPGPLSHSSSRSQSLSLPLPHTALSPPLPPLSPSLPVWVTPGWVFLWSWDGFFLLTRALPDNTAQPDTNIIKNEELLVRVPANADMKWKVGGEERWAPDSSEGEIKK